MDHFSSGFEKTSPSPVRPNDLDFLGQYALARKLFWQVAHELPNSGAMLLVHNAIGESFELLQLVEPAFNCQTRLIVFVPQRPYFNLARGHLFGVRSNAVAHQGAFAVQRIRRHNLHPAPTLFQLHHGSNAVGIHVNVRLFSKPALSGARIVCDPRFDALSAWATLILDQSLVS